MSCFTQHRQLPEAKKPLLWRGSAERGKESRLHAYYTNGPFYPRVSAGPEKAADMFLCCVRQVQEAEQGLIRFTAKSGGEMHPEGC